MASPFDGLGITVHPVDDGKPSLPPIFVHVEDETAGYRDFVDTLAQRSSPGKAFHDGVQSRHEETMAQEIARLDGASTHTAKMEAILADRADLLRLLLRRAPYIDELMVLAACERKDRASVRLLLDFGWPIDEPIHLVASLLSIAVDDLEFTQWLIDAGANVDARNNVDESALSVAIAQGSMDVVHFLLMQEPDITRGDLVHHAAMRKNHLEGAAIVEQLANKGADVDAYRYNNSFAQYKGLSLLQTPLYMACSHRNHAVAKVLLRLKADPHRRMLNAGSAPLTPIDNALQSDDQVMITLLEAHSPRNRASL